MTAALSHWSTGLCGRVRTQKDTFIGKVYVKTRNFCFRLIKTKSTTKLIFLYSWKNNFYTLLNGWIAVLQFFKSRWKLVILHRNIYRNVVYHFYIATITIKNEGRLNYYEHQTFIYYLYSHILYIILAVKTISKFIHVWGGLKLWNELILKL